MNIYGLGPYGYGSSEPDEMEALQSDVMRFMAILGLCLMIIFALVQSLPQSSTDGKIPKDLTVTASVEESVQLDKETDSLKTERDRSITTSLNLSVLQAVIRICCVEKISVSFLSGLLNKASSTKNRQKTSTIVISHLLL